MALKQVRRVIEGICSECLGTGWIITGKGRADCTKCGGTGKKNITIVEFVQVEE